MPTQTKKPTKKKAAGNGSAPYAKCEECGAPLDEKQRYCVSCGARRRDEEGPAVKYLAKAGRKTRSATGRAKGASGARAAAVLFFVVLPIAVAIGVLVGKGNGGNNDQQLADAIKQLQTSRGSGSQLASTGAATPIASDFTLDQGFTVELKTLPSSSDQAAVDAAKKDATSKGATDVGIINPSDFTVTPAPQGGGLVLYSGQFKTRDEANKALAKLKSKFLGAVVVEVKRSAGAAGAGKLVAKTQYGDVHQVSGFQATPQKVASDTALVNQEGKKTGQDYVGSQKNLPDVIVVGGSGGGSTSSPGAQGNGD
jgi:sporulation related protein